MSADDKNMGMKRRIIVIINPACHQGEGTKRWQMIRQEVLSRLGEGVTEHVSSSDGELRDLLRRSLDTGDDHVLISAGGDGSVHHLVSLLLEEFPGHLDRIRVGAIGLGSSNDFLKPVRTMIKGVPVRIGIDEPVVEHDVGVVTALDQDGRTVRDHFIVNASFGATAEGNWRFNHPGPLLRKLKSRSTPLAILYATLSTVLGYRNKPCRVIYDGRPRSLNLTNLNLLKIPYVSGSLHYDQDIRPGDGSFMLNICHGMGRLEMIRALGGLGKGKFPAGPHTATYRITEMRMEAPVPMAFECDGETMLVRDVSITLSPHAIKALR